MIMRLMQNRPVLLAVIVGSVVAAAGAAVSTGAVAANRRSAIRGHVVRGSAAPTWPFSVFSHPAKARAHRADVGKVSAPQGAVLAGVSDMDGVANELYAWHKTPSEDCLVDVEGGSEVTTACSPSAAAEAEGISWVGTNSGATGATGAPGAVSVVVMVPDGVSRIEVTSSDGLTTGVNVTDDVAAMTEVGIKEYRYTMPDGKVVTRKGESLSAEDEVH